MRDYYLFLDDQRNPMDVFWVSIPKVEYVVVRNYSQFVDVIKKRGLPKFVSFDHDLSDIQTAQSIVVNLAGSKFNYDNNKELTGLHCARYLIDYCIDNSLDFPQYEVHSMSNVGKANIISLIESFQAQK